MSEEYDPPFSLREEQLLHNAYAEVADRRPGKLWRNIMSWGICHAPRAWRHGRTTSQLKRRWRDLRASASDSRETLPADRKKLRRRVSRDGQGDGSTPSVSQSNGLIMRKLYHGQYIAEKATCARIDPYWATEPLLQSFDVPVIPAGLNIKVLGRRWVVSDKRYEYRVNLFDQGNAFVRESWEAESRLGNYEHLLRSFRAHEKELRSPLIKKPQLSSPSRAMSASTDDGDVEVIDLDSDASTSGRPKTQNASSLLSPPISGIKVDTGTSSIAPSATEDACDSTIGPSATENAATANGVDTAATSSETEPTVQPQAPSTGNFEIESLAARRICSETNMVQYLVKWKGYTVDESTWEPLRNLLPEYLDGVLAFESMLAADSKTNRVAEDSAVDITDKKRKRKKLKLAGKKKSVSVSSTSPGALYEVEKIVGRRTLPSGIVQYLVHWTGFSSSERTWEPVALLSNVSDLVKEFDASTQ